MTDAELIEALRKIAEVFDDINWGLSAKLPREAAARLEALVKERDEMVESFKKIQEETKRHPLF